MKKLTAILMTAILFLIPFTAYAAEVDSLPMMGDVNGDGRVTAADAREILRYSAKLSAEGDFSPLRADTDGNGSITAADARNTLRVAAQISNFACGFNKNGAPCATDLLKSKNYVMTTSDGFYDYVIAERNKDVCYFIENYADYVPDVGTVTESGFMYLNGKFYSLGTIEGVRYAVIVPDSMIKDAFGEDFAIDLFRDYLGLGHTDDFGTPEKANYDGVTYYKYPYMYDGTSLDLVTDTEGRIVASMMDSDTLVTVSSVSNDDIDSYFDLRNYTVLEYE